MTTVTGIRELRDGKTIVLDATGRSLFLFDWSASRTTRISRSGYGPREYSQPTRLIALAGDSTLVHDPGNDRYLVLGAAGQPIGSLPEFGVTSSKRNVFEVTIHGADAAGRLYFALPSALVREKHATPILRFDRRRGVADTVGTVAEGSDDWVVLPQGGVGIVRESPFRVEWHPTEGDEVVGPPLNYSRSRISGAAPSVLFGPDGRMWVARVAGEWADVVTYDIFGRTGERVERMTLAAGSRVVGFGPGRVYVVRRDEAGELFLDRFPIAGS